MTDPRDAFIAARDARDVRAMLAALESWLDVLTDETILELLVLCDAPEFADRKRQGRLETLLGRAIWRAVQDPPRLSPEYLRWALDRWQASSDYHCQSACDIAARMLLRDPADERALDLYIQASVADPYAHRGTNLADIAAHTSAPQLRARLLLADAFIDYIVFHHRDRAAEAVHRALAADPTLDYDAARTQFFAHLGLTDTPPTDRDAALPPRDAW